MGLAGVAVTGIGTGAAVGSLPDEHVPDPQVARELGVTLMTLWRYTHDPNLGFPPPIKLRNRNFRSRRMLEEFKERMLRSAIAQPRPDRRHPAPKPLSGGGA
jgi:hypothetical protein